MKSGPASIRRLMTRLKTAVEIKAVRQVAIAA